MMNSSDGGGRSSRRRYEDPSNQLLGVMKNVVGWVEVLDSEAMFRNSYCRSTSDKVR